MSCKNDCVCKKPKTNTETTQISQVNVKIKKLDNFIALPEYKTKGAAAMDLYSAEDVILEHGKVSMVSTGIAIGLPVGYEAQIRARSGLASKGVIVVNSPGTIDFDYTGPVKILLSCLNTDNFKIKKGDRIAQMVIAPITKANLVVVEELDETERGTGSFGSTGI